MMRGSVLSVVLAIGLVQGGCDKSGQSEEEKPSPSATDDAEEGNKRAPTTGAKEKTRRDRAKRDKGSLSMLVDDQLWEAKGASAYVGKDRLTVSAAKTNRDGTRTAVEQIRLVIHGFHGVGEYELGMQSSFAAAALGDEDVKNAEGDDAKASTVVMGGLKSGKATLLKNAKLQVTASSDDAVDGTFSWAPNGGYNGPTLTEGKFHATFRKKRK